MNPLWILLLLLVLTYIAYVLIVYFLFPSPPARIGPEVIDLSSVTQVIPGVDLSKSLVNTAGSTLIFYINPIINDRTSQSGNEYATPVNIGGKQKFNILVAPDAGRANTMSPATLDVYVKGHSTPETIELANFPLQRWSGVAIVKQGSKFNIYINGLLSASHKCTAMPDFDQTHPLNVGDIRLNGQIALMSIAAYPMQAGEIKSMYDSSVDIEGKPYLSSGISFIPTINITGMCPGGNCLTPIKAPSFEEWGSSY